MTWTILGASGFVGSHLVKALTGRGEAVYAPRRGDPLADRDLGDVIYCIGVTADFRRRPFDTVEAHVGYLKPLLQTAAFNSLTYLSSTRVYKGLQGTVDESARLQVDPNDADDLYNISKLLGESLALSCGRPTKVVRLSNVYGPDLHSANFLTSVLRDALEQGHVTLRTARDSAKDYISVAQVVDMLPAIARTGRSRIYNVAAGQNLSHGDLVDAVQRLTGCSVSCVPDAPTVRFPTLDVGRVVAEFGFQARLLLHDLPRLIETFTAPAGLTET